LRMICSAVCPVRFMVESPAQSGLMRTLIHPGPVSRVRVTALRVLRAEAFPLVSQHKLGRHVTRSLQLALQLFYECFDLPLVVETWISVSFYLFEVSTGLSLVP